MAESVSGHSGHADSTAPLKARIAQTRSQEEGPKPPTASGTTTPKLTSRPTYMTGTTAQSQESHSHESFLLHSMNATKDAIDLDGYFVRYS